MSDPLAEDGRAARFVPPPPPRTPKSAGTRRRLLEVAAELFIDRGYAAVSMRDIAAAASLTKGALYGHFRSKGQLLVEVIRSKLPAGEDTPLDELARNYESTIGMMYDASGREIRLLEVDAAAAARHDPDVEAGLSDLYRNRQAQVRAAISDIPDPDTVAWLILMLAAGIAMKEATRVPFPEAEQLRNVLLRSLRALT